MTLKILLPAIIGLLIYFLGKSHARRVAAAPAVSSSQKAAAAGKFRLSFRWTAIILVGVTVLSAIWVVYEEWQAGRKPVVVRVINVQTGATTAYQALQGQVHGRTFQTLDGRQVRLADVERMEVGE
ncbi:MAG: hypothetical protein H7835_08465 [Magnetococcus sp. XQGC-1]